MKNLELSLQRIPVDMGDGTVIQVEIAPTVTGLKEVAGGVPVPFQSISNAITRISQEVVNSIKNAAPTKATVKYGLDINIEQGSLMATIVRGSGSASLEITLEWDNSVPK